MTPMGEALLVDEETRNEDLSKRDRVRTQLAKLPKRKRLKTRSLNENRAQTAG